MKLDDTLKIVQALEDQNILLKGVTKIIKNETNQQRGGFLSMLMGTLGASLLGDILAKSLLGGKGDVRAGEGMYRAGSDSKIKNYWREGVYRAGKGI